MFIRENKSSPESLKLWNKRIRSQLEFLENFWNGYPSWRASYLLDRAIHWVDKSQKVENASEDTEAKLTVPLISTHIRNLMPFLFNKNPIFYGSPFSDETDKVMQVIAQIDYLNYSWVQQSMSRQARRAILDAAIIGHGIIQTGWYRELNETEDKDKKGIINYSDYIKEESPFIRRINPFNFLFDRHSPESDLNSSRWCCEILYRPFQDVIDDIQYSADTRAKLETQEITPTIAKDFIESHQGSGQENEFLFTPLDKQVKEEIEPDSLIVLNKIYDKKFKTVRTILDLSEEEAESGELKVIDWPYDHLEGDFPFIKVDFEEIPDSPYGIGHVRYLHDIQRNINRNRTKIYQVTKAFNPKYVYSGNEPLEAPEAEKIILDQFGSVINIKPGATLTPMTAPTNSRDLYESASLLSQDYAEVSGEDVLQRGGLLPSRTSAEEIRERARLRGLRLEANVDNTYEFLLKIGNHIIKHTRRYLRTEKAVAVLGSRGEIYNTIDHTKAQEKFHLRLSSVAKDPDPPEVKRRQLLEFLQTIANPNIFQLLQAFKTPLNFNYLIRMLVEQYGFREMYNIFPNIEQMTIPQNIIPTNTAPQPGVSQNPEGEQTRQLQQDNVAENSNVQGLRGFLSGLGGQ